MSICQTSENAGMVTGLLSSVDCHVRVLVHESYARLVGPDTTFAAVLTGLLTIYIALFGYQLLLGRGGLRLAELPVAALKIGLILAFTTSWAAYQAVFFGLLFDGPLEIATILLEPMGRLGVGPDGDYYAGLEQAFYDMSGAASAYGAGAPPTANILQGGPSLGAGLLWLSSIGMLLATIGIVLAAKVILAFLLAIGPIFIGFLLFDQTRGLFDGWLRTTIGLAFVPLAANVFGAAMLTMLSPFLRALLLNVERGVVDMGLIITVGLIVTVFSFIMLMSVRIGTSIAASWGGGIRSEVRGPAPQGHVADPWKPSREGAAAHVSPGSAHSETNSDDGRRARETADAFVAVSPAVDRLGQRYKRTTGLSERAQK